MFAAAVAGGCGGGGGSQVLTSPAAAPCSTPGAAVASIVAPLLAYPLPGATGVPVSAGALILYMYNNPAVVPLDVQIIPQGQAAIDLGLAVQPSPGPYPSPFAPLPAASPQPQNAGAVTLPTLSHNTVYTVQVKSPSVLCPILGNAQPGSFTTN